MLANIFVENSDSAIEELDVTDGMGSLDQRHVSYVCSLSVCHLLFPHFSDEWTMFPVWLDSPQAHMECLQQSMSHIYADCRFDGDGRWAPVDNEWFHAVCVCSTLE